jgi:hypothetical protein
VKESNNMIITVQDIWDMDIYTIYSNNKEKEETTTQHEELNLQLEVVEVEDE